MLTVGGTKLMNAPHPKSTYYMVIKKTLPKIVQRERSSVAENILHLGGKKRKENATLQISHPPSSTALSEEEEETDLGPAAGPSLTDPAGG